MLCYYTKYMYTLVQEHGQNGRGSPTSKPRGIDSSQRASSRVLIFWFIVKYQCDISEKTTVCIVIFKF